MWIPQLELRPSGWFSGLILLLHLAVAVALWWFPAPLRWLMLPLVMLSALLSVAKHGQLWLAHSVCRIDRMPDGWFLTLKNGNRIGPLQLAPATRLESAFVRLSFIPAGEDSRRHIRYLQVRHVLLTPHRIGPSDYHRLQLYLRWHNDAGTTGVTGSRGRPGLG